MQTTITDQQVVLKVSGLRKSFGNLVAVDNLNLEVRKGEIFGFLGPNGAGKTTSIKMMTGITKPDSGEIEIFGEHINASSDVKTRIGVCPQNIILWQKLTCLEQLIFSSQIYDIPKKEAKKRSLHLLDKMGLIEKKNKLASTLSGGMQRRMNIIMALVHNPEIVVFDEPEAGLDPQSRVLVREFIREVSNEKTVILTTHNMDEAERLADRVAIIDHGKLLKLDTPDALKSSIGEGDILEFEIISKNANDAFKAEEILSNMNLEINHSANHFTIKALHIIEKLADISAKLKENNISAGELKLRANTLEDVFIHLTGRRLRQ